LRHLSLIPLAASLGLLASVPLTLGLAGQPEASSIEITWPSGGTTKLEHVKAGQKITIREGTGLVTAAPLGGSAGKVVALPQ